MPASPLRQAIRRSTVARTAREDPMQQAGVSRYPHMDQVVFGRPCADVVADEATRLDATRVFVIASGTLNRTTDVVKTLVARIGNRHAGTWDRIASHTPRTDCVAAANA